MENSNILDIKKKRAEFYRKSYLRDETNILDTIMSISSDPGYTTLSGLQFKITHVRKNAFNKIQSIEGVVYPANNKEKKSLPVSWDTRFRCVSDPELSIGKKQSIDQLKVELS